MFKQVLFLFILSLSTLTACTTRQLNSAYALSGDTMTPTYTGGTILGIDEQAYKSSLPQRGDIVIFDHPSPKNEMVLLKRIIGLPGETVEILNGDVLIDGMILEEPYLDKQPTYNGRWQLGENEYFVLGDNRNASSDSHSWGPLPFENIIGKAVAICSSKLDWSCNRKIEPIDYSK